MTSYTEFLETKKVAHIHSGFDIKETELPGRLFPFQKFVVKRALAAGKYAIFSGCGTGKTGMQCSWANEVYEKTGRPVIILAPLAVVPQTIKEATKFGIQVNRHGELNANIQVTNYEQLDNIDESLYSGVVIDESGILKDDEGKYRNLIIDKFRNTPYKLACSATPSPNDPMELGNHAEFLNVISYTEMLAMYFVHDGGDTSKWRLKNHSKKLFWRFVSTWAVMFGHPRDIGFEQDGFDLPPLNYIEREIVTPKRNNGKLLNDDAVSATNFNQELRLTKVQRIDEVVGIVNGELINETVLIWIKHNDEGEILKKMIPGSVEVTGSDTPEFKEKTLLAFAEGKIRVLITKMKIAAWGMNFQNAHNMIFASPDFSFEQVYQAIRRMLRFGQQKTVNAYLVITDTMSNVIQSFKRKEAQNEEMQREMSAAVIETLNIINKPKKERLFMQYKTEYVDFQLGDCVELIKNVPDESVGFSIFSPPFADLYCYSDEIEDMGNSKDYKEFLVAFGFLVKELYRVLWSGRNISVHCMDLPIQKGKEGFIGLRDFSGMILKAFSEAGFIYHSRVTIWKDPVTEMQRTKALGLLHKQIKKDASMSRVGIPDYLLIFRKPGEHLHPVLHQDTDPRKPNFMPVDTWQKYASPVWMDINYSKTLNARDGRTADDEKHICPLQLETIERALHLWTNEGDTVLTPFGGIGSELYQSLLMKRKAIGFELKKSYFETGIKNIQDADIKSKEIKLMI
jgi:superfamily II DNA or RNA helicase